MTKKFVFIITFAVFLLACNIEQDNLTKPEKSTGLCSDLNEDECYNNDRCFGVYGASLCSGDTCTTDIVFKDCQEIPKAIFEKSEQDKILCEETGGEWISDRFSKPGSCSCPESSFSSDVGCMVDTL